MTWLCGLGHLASTAAVRAQGATGRALARAVERGELLRLRTGLYGCAHLDEQQVGAARAGGLIDCVSALSRQPDVWSGPRDPRSHVRLAPHGHLLSSDAAVVHWREQFGVAVDVTVAAEDALLQSMSCLDPYDSLAAIESSLHLGYLPRDRLDALLDRAPERMHRTLDRLNVLAQSGLETHARVRLEDAGHRVECQVGIPGAGRIDLLVDGCVGIETDGRKWHEHRFIEDRTKDLTVAMWGIPVVRLTKAHVIEAWPETVFAIERLVAQQRRRA